MGSHRLSYLSIDRPAPFLLIAQSVVGLFRSAGGLVLLSGGKLGPQIFPPLVLRTIRSQRRRGDRVKPKSPAGAADDARQHARQIIYLRC